MGRIRTLRDLFGVIKDKASLSKATLISKPNKASLHQAVLRATTHSPSGSPNDHHLSNLLTLGDSSRATASAVVHSLMDRLHRTRDAHVALKCLVAVHHIVSRGSFILQDQLSVFPTSGGRNYLKLSDFRDGATPKTWALSAWVRWYARYLETILSVSRILGFFFSSSSCHLEKDKEEERVSSSTNVDLIRDVDSLVGWIQELCEVPDSLLVEGNPLLYEVMVLTGSDYLAAVNEFILRLGEFKERLSGLTFGESVELVCALKRLESCRERLSALFTVVKPPIGILWGLIDELKGKLEILKAYRGEVKREKHGRLEKGSESARFGQRVIMSADSVQFSSGRFGLELNEYSSVVLECIDLDN